MTTVELLRPFESEYNRLFEESDFGTESDKEALETYIDENIDRVIDILFPEMTSNIYAKQMKYLLIKNPDSIRDTKLAGFFEFLKLPTYTSSYSEIADLVISFLKDEPSASLTYSFGFGDQLVQIFPQDKQYIDKVFRTHKKNVILGFGYFSGDHGLSSNGGNLFNVEVANANSKRFKERTCAIFQSTFGLERKDITLKKYKDFALSFEFSKDGSDYIFYWVNLPIDPLKLLYFYKPMLDKFDERYIIDTVASDPGHLPLDKRDIRKLQFIKDYFKATLFRGRGENIGTFQNTGFLLTKNTIKGKHSVKNEKTKEWINVTNVKNMWNGFGGNRKTRRLRKTRGKK
jgi:hypothetical protein